MLRIASARTAGIVAGFSAVAVVTAGCSSNNEAAGPATGAAATSAVISSAVTTSSAESAGTTVTETATATSAAASGDGQVTLTGERGVEVTLTGPIGVKYSAATEAQREQLGLPLTGDHNAGTRESGVVFQQFQGGVIVAANDQAGTQAYIVSGPIRNAWNIERNAQGAPDPSGMNGSAGPLGYPTSDATTDGDVQTATFQHGSIRYNTATGEAQVTVNGHVNPAETFAR